MDISTGEIPHIVQKLNALPLKNTQSVWDELEMLEKVGIISQSVSPGKVLLLSYRRKLNPERYSIMTLTIMH